MKRIPKLKYMTEDQLQKIIDNGYRSDVAHGYGYDYEATFGKDEIDLRLWEIQEKKAQKEIEKRIKEMEEMPEDEKDPVPF